MTMAYGHIFLPHTKHINEVWANHQNWTLSEATKRWGSDCPCCGRAMVKPDGEEARTMSGVASFSTRGHDIPQAVGGAHWLYICNACNTEQRQRSFRKWAEHLEANPSASAFAGRVRDVADFMERMRLRALIAFVERIRVQPEPVSDGVSVEQPSTKQSDILIRKALSITKAGLAVLLASVCIRASVLHLSDGNYTDAAAMVLGTAWVGAMWWIYRENK